MLLSDNQIQQKIAQGAIAIEPFTPDSVKGASLDLSLGTNFLKICEHSSAFIKLNEQPKYNRFEADPILIPPHAFILATTVEKITLSADIAGLLEGRSSIGRMGLFIQNAGLVVPGFSGQLTLELYNANNLAIQLSAHTKICQLLFFQLQAAASRPYIGKYQNQLGVTGSKSFQEYQSASIMNNPPQPQNQQKTAENTTIFLGADHAGFSLKKELIQYLEKHHWKVVDSGTYATDSVDYPDFAAKVAQSMDQNKNSLGILICGSGQGMVMSANRFNHVRAALCFDEQTATLARQHNNANVLCLGARFLQTDKAYAIVQSFLTATYEAGRHQKRLDKMTSILS